MSDFFDKYRNLFFDEKNQRNNPHKYLIEF